VKEGAAAVQCASTNHALAEVGQIAHQAGHPQLKVRHRHPDIWPAQSRQNRKSQPKHGIIGFAVRQQLVEQLRHMRQRDRPRITYFRRQGRFQDLAGVQSR
jgi:hypothetical protein